MDGRVRRVLGVDLWAARDGRMRSPAGAAAAGTGALKPGREKAPPTRGRRGLLEMSATWWVLPVWARAKDWGRTTHNPLE